MLRRLLVIPVALATLAACGGGGDPTGPAAVASVEVSAPPRAIASLGETLTLTAAGKTGKGKAVGGLTFTWASSNPGVATVNGGVVTAVGNGTTSISATTGSSTGSTQVTVQQVASQVVVTFVVDTIRAYGDTARAIATARDAGGSAMSAVTATWTSTNPAVVTVDGTGLMTAVSEGSATIRAVSTSLQGERVVQVRQRAAKLVVTRQPVGARAGLAIETQPQAEVQDARGNRVTTDNSTVVTASIATGGGTIVAGGIATSNAGLVSFSTLAVGGTVGAKVLQFTAASVSSVNSNTFTLTAGIPSSVVVVGGNNQTGLAGVALGQPLQAGVRDGYGNAVAAVPVSFSVQQGGGSLGADVVNSDANGNASTAYTLSRYAGNSTVRAATAAAPQAQALFLATATPNGVIRGTVTASASGIPAVSAPVAARAAEVASRTSHRRLRVVPSTLPPLSLRSDKRPQAPAVSMAGTPATSTPAIAANAAVPGELLVTYRPERINAPSIGASSFQQPNVVSAVSASIRQAMSPVVDAGIVSVLSVSPVLLTARVKVAAGTTEAEAMARLRADPRVQSVERNGYMSSHVVPPTAMESLMANSGLLGSAAPVPLAVLANPFPDAGTNSSYPFGGLFPGNALYMRQAWHYNVVSLPQAWTLTQGSTNVLVAVVDDGVRFDHPAMAGVLTNDGYDFVSVGTIPLCNGGLLDLHGDGDGYDPNPTQPAHHDRNQAGTCALPVKNSGNHGLHVSGTIGAVRTSSTGLVGVNWNVRIRMVRSLGTHGSGSFYDIAQGVLYAAGLPADNGAGGTVIAAGGRARVINMSLGGTGFSATLGNAVAAAYANGVLIIASAGNNNSSTPNYPASFPDVVSVSAVAPTLNRASYSSFGSSVKVAAPGGQTSAGPSHGVLSSTWNYVTNSATLDSWQGTSMAAPHVSGIAALILAREPQLTAAQLSARLTGFAIDLGQPGQDDLFGAGLVNARNAMTASFSAPRQLYVRLVNATTGATVRTVATSPAGAYEIGGVADGQYWVFAGHDENGDGLTGLPWRTWGALGAASGPATVIVDGAGVYPGTFSISTGFEVEPNNTADQADELVVDGFVNADLSTTADVDLYRLRVPAQGTYVLQATGQVGACGFALESDPIITVFSSAGAQLGENDDIDFAGNNLCSQLTMQLTPGDYWVRVGGFSAGRYVILARKL